MAIHFEWYENPVPPNQPDEKKLHARITYNGKIGTDYVRRKNSGALLADGNGCNGCTRCAVACIGAGAG